MPRYTCLVPKKVFRRLPLLQCPALNLIMAADFTYAFNDFLQRNSCSVSCAFACASNTLTFNGDWLSIRPRRSHLMRRHTYDAAEARDDYLGGAIMGWVARPHCIILAQHTPLLICAAVGYIYIRLLLAKIKMPYAYIYFAAERVHYFRRRGWQADDSGAAYCIACRAWCACRLAAIPFMPRDFRTRFTLMPCCLLRLQLTYLFLMSTVIMLLIYYIFAIYFTLGLCYKAITIVAMQVLRFSNLLKSLSAVSDNYGFYYILARGPELMMMWRFLLSASIINTHEF